MRLTTAAVWLLTCLTHIGLVICVSGPADERDLHMLDLSLHMPGNLFLDSLDDATVATPTVDNITCIKPNSKLTEDDAKEFISCFHKERVNMIYESRELAWAYQTNLTEHNKNAKFQAALQHNNLYAKYVEYAQTFNTSSMNKTTIDGIKFILGFKASNRTNAANEKKLADIDSTMEGIYSKAKVRINGTCLAMEPGLTRLMSKSRDYDQLLEAWKGWRDATGKKMSTMYVEHVNLTNQKFRGSGYNDTGVYWRSVYNTPTFEEDVKKLFRQVAPLYEQLHAYTRRKLKAVYGADKFPESGHIPAHLLGNMWAQSWESIIDILQPFPNKAGVDVTTELIKQNYTVKRMFELSESFFTSLGLSAMPKPFWDKSMLVRPTDGRDVVCHASAWDFYNKKDFRIKMCTDINHQDLITIHHEMGHVQYYLQYKDQPISYRRGANPGFHEAIGDFIALSVQTPEHLNKIGLLQKVSNDAEEDLNFLMSMALKKIAFLPFGYLIDQWRWSAYNEDSKPDSYNRDWWELRQKYQGVSPPVQRYESDFDPGAKYHVAADVPYIRYFVAHIVQFQFHKAACDKIGYTGPLHHCDIYNNTDAGDLLGNMLKMGSSKPWPEAMKAMTGKGIMDVQPLMEYFKPLMTYLEKENGNDIGWDSEIPPNVPKITDEQKASDFLDKYETDMSKYIYELEELSWAYNTNLTDYNKDRLVKKQLENAAVTKKFAKMAAQYDTTDMDSDIIGRMKDIKNVGVSAQTDQKKAERLSIVGSNMEEIYSKAKVPLNGKLLAMEPGLTRLMAESRDYNDLLNAWKGWRDMTGKKMKDDYAEQVALQNDAISLAGYNDTGEYWRSAYDTPTFEEDVKKLFRQVAPLYEQLHAYTRRKLKAVYGADKFPESGHIPAHLLGNMWAQSWGSLIDILQPFPNKTGVDVTPELIKQNYTVGMMFQLSETFFTSLGLPPMPERFWEKSMLVRPTDGREVVCHASAWDFYNQKDFRIKMCTDITHMDLITIHHEMGHIEYFLEYKNQTISYRGGANPGFHEAIGDFIALSVQTPEHMKTIGLLGEVSDDTESDINFQMSMALEKIAFLPFGYLIDQWRWSVFSGDTKPDNYNSDWWQLRCRYQGVSPPVPRSNSDFDPGAKYHVAANTPYIRYFVSFIIQFQFHKAACDKIGYTGPLHHCDIYNNKDAGDLLGKMLQMGSSKSWPEAMKAMTGQEKMDAQPLMEYFQPLMEYLEEQNGNDFGWDPICHNQKLSPRVRTIDTTSKPDSGTLTAPIPAFISSLVIITLFLIVR